MKILITHVGAWLDKGEAAMIVATVRDLREKLPSPEITITRGVPLQEIDKLKYGQYGLRVLPALVSYSLSALSNIIKSLRFRPFKVLVALPIFLISILRLTLWLLFQKLARIDIKLLIRNNRDTVKAYKDMDCYIFCGGQNLINLGSGLVAALYEIVFSKVLGKPVMIWANSLGPFNPRYIRPFIRWVLNKVDLITTREAISKKILDDISVTAPAFVTADAAFTLPHVSREEAMGLIERQTGNIKNELLVGISAIPWDFPNESSEARKTELFENYLEVLAAAADYVIGKLNAYVIFFPQVIIPTVKDDRPIAAKVLGKMGNESQAAILTDDYTPEQIKGMYGCMSLLIGTRFHSCILAQSMKVPTVAIEYDGHKAAGIMRLLELEDYVSDIYVITTDELISKIDKIWAERDGVRKKLEKNIGIMQAKSMDNVRLALEYLGLRKNLTP